MPARGLAAIALRSRCWAAIWPTRIMETFVTRMKWQDVLATMTTGSSRRRVMESYQTWFGDGPELSVLRMLGLFDRPADEKALEALLKPPVIPGLTESLISLTPAERRTVFARLTRARLLAGDDPHSRGNLDTHPLVREYSAERLRSQRTEAWKECNRRLFHHYQTLAPQLPASFQEMEPLFLAVICGCNAGLFREALHKVYIPRIQRGNASFAGNVLGARGPLLSVLVHFFENGHWGSLVEAAVKVHAGSTIFNGHARNGSNGSANMLRTRGVLVSSP